MAEFHTGWRGLIRNTGPGVPKDHDDQGPILSAAEKAAASKGQRLSGPITLAQFEVLNSNGYDGDETKRWSAHKAEKEITSRDLILNKQCPFCKRYIRPERFEKHIEQFHKS